MKSLVRHNLFANKMLNIYIFNVCIGNGKREKTVFPYFCIGTIVVPKYLDREWEWKTGFPTQLGKDFTKEYQEKGSCLCHGTLIRSRLTCRLLSLLDKYNCLDLRSMQFFSQNIQKLQRTKYICCL